MFMFAADAKQRPAPRFTLQIATATPKAKWLGALGSLAIHGVTVGAAVVLTMPQSTPTRPERVIDLEPILHVPPSPGQVAPDRPSGPAPLDASITIPVVPPVDVPTGVPPIPQQAPDRPTLGPTGGREIDLGAGATGGLGADPTAVFNRDFVDEPPVLLSSPRLEYPRLLLRTGVEGTVVIEVVIDTLGLPERGTMRVTASPHAALSAAALDVVGRSRYRSGRLDGRRVRVLVSVPVVFRIER